MRKTYKYTIVTLILAVAFSFGSMAVVRLLLQARERQILSENGKFELAESVWEQQKQKEISVEDIENTVSRWEGNEMSVHELREGQIFMEEAIRSGREWMNEMDLEDEYNYTLEGDMGDRVYSVHAVLGVMTSEELTEDDREPSDSFWRVEFTSKYRRVFLYVNAVTGKVWSADITMYETLPEQMPYWKLKTFVELAGLEPSYKSAVRNQDGTEAAWDIEDSRLYARMEFQKNQKSVRLIMKLAIEEDE